MLVWLVAGIVVVDGKHVEQIQEGLVALSKCDVKTLMTRNHTAFQVRRSP